VTTDEAVGWIVSHGYAVTETRVRFVREEHHVVVGWDPVREFEQCGAADDRGPCDDCLLTIMGSART